MEDDKPQRGAARLILAAAALLMVWTVWRALDPRLTLLSWDFGGHLLRAKAFLTDAVGAGRFSAWFPYWHGGLPMTEVYPPLATWLLAMAHGIAGEAGARALLALVWIAALPSSFLFLRRSGLPPVPAAVGASLVIALDAPRTFGVQAIFWLGLLPNGLGFVLAILTLAETRGLVEAPTRNRALRVGLLGGLTILAHPFCAYWAALTAGLLLAVESVGRAGAAARLRFAALAGAVALAIGAYQWVPFLLNRGNVLVTDPFVTLSVAGTWKALAGLAAAGGLPAALLSLGGAAVLGARRRGRALAFFALAAGASLALSLGIMPLAGDLVGPSQRARFEGFYLWIMLMLAGHAVEALMTMSGARRRVAGGVFAALLVGGIVLHGARGARPNAAAAPAPAMAELAPLTAALTARFVPGDFILSENDRATFRRTGSPHLFNQRLPLGDRRLWDQGGGLPEGSRAALPMFVASRSFPSSVVDGRADLARHGVRFVATTRAESAAALDGVPWLTRIWPAAGAVRGTLALFEVTPFTSRFGLDGDSAARLTSANYSAKGGYELSFSSETRLSFPLETAISFHPWLRASAGGAPVALASAADGRLILAGGPVMVSRLQVVYSPPASIGIVRALALLALVAVLGLLAAPRRGAPRP